MVLTKIEFYDARNQTLNTQHTAALVTINAIDVISCIQPKVQVLGDSLYQYNASNYKISIKYNKLLGTIVLDQFGMFKPLDDIRILNKYMIIISFDDRIQALYILNQTIDYSLQQNYFNFEATPGIGVLAKYASDKPNIIKNDLLVPVPHNVRFLPGFSGSSTDYNSPTWTNIVGTTYTAKIGQLYATSLYDIMTQNNNPIHGYNYYNDNDSGSKFFVDTSKIAAVQSLNIVDLGFNNSYISRPYSIHILNDFDYTNYGNTTNQAVTDFISWDDKIILPAMGNHTITASNPALEPTYGTDRRIQKFYADTVAGIYRDVYYGQRMCIDFLCDTNGKTFTQLITDLTNNNFFTYSAGNTPYLLTSSADPGDIPSGSYVIGIYPDRPTWLSYSCSYSYRNPDNDGIKRSLQLQYWKYGFKRQAVINGLQNQTNVRGISLAIGSEITLNNPSALGDWRVKYTAPFQDFMTSVDYDVEDYFGKVYPDYITDAATRQSDDYCKFYRDSSQDKVKMSYDYTSGSLYTFIAYTMDLNSDLDRLNDLLRINAPLLLDGINWKLQTDLNPIDMLKQVMLYTNMSIIQKKGVTYDSSKQMGFNRRIYTNQLNVVPQQDIYNISDQHTVQQYKFIPFIKTKYNTIQDRYNTMRNVIAADNALGIYYNQMQNQYYVKIVIALIGAPIFWQSIINLNDKRYFKFRNKRYICTSVQIDTANDLYIIEGYGGLA